MTHAYQTLAAIAARPHHTSTARQIVETQTGRKLPPVADMDAADREAVKRLAVARVRAGRAYGRQVARPPCGK